MFTTTVPASISEVELIFCLKDGKHLKVFLRSNLISFQLLVHTLMQKVNRTILVGIGMKVCLCFTQLVFKHTLRDYLRK